MKEILTRYDDEITRHIVARRRAAQDEVRRIMRERFGLQTLEEVKEFAKGENLALAWDVNKEFIGVVRNNRWLYTTTGQVIGKQGKRWMIEKINKKSYGTR